MSLLEAALLAVVEGLTEFLPVSSTGHLIIASALLGIEPTVFSKNFLVIIQLPAILAVLVLYWRRFLQSVRLYVRLLIAFVPAAVVGLAFGDTIDGLLENVTVVAVALLVGGVVLLWVDRLFAANEQRGAGAEVTERRSVVVGLFQCLSLVPGVSRSAATIVGGLASGVDRKTAAEFSFLLAVPTMLAATLYKLYKTHAAGELAVDNLPVLGLGAVVAFGVALVAIRGFLRYLVRYGFRAFGWYRIAVGGALLVLQYVLKVPLSIVG
ncbi:MAG: undecaprenyl-diphosphate phosphatase [Bacteroidia bacterium]|nr:undecaprenyl-diphosphate phosphatase [Bacteroidia bacterium]